MAPLITLGYFGRFGRVNIQSFVDTGSKASGLAACASVAATSGHSHARCAWVIGSFALLGSLRYFASGPGGGQKLGVASPRQCPSQTMQRFRGMGLTEKEKPTMTERWAPSVITDAAA